jgi:hypothetical protein
MSSLHAGVFTESPDAGPLLHNAAQVPAGTTQIIGSLTDQDVDLYQLIFPRRSSVSFSVTPTGTWFDDDMTVFNSSGNPLAVSDFAFTFEFPAGTYYFGLSDWDIVALGNDGQIIADDYYGILDPNGVLAGWAVNSTPFRAGPYEINMIIVPFVPEPSGLLIFAMFMITGVVVQRPLRFSSRRGARLVTNAG